jgi:hypothetical protein
MLEQAKPYNEFTPEFRAKLEEHVRGFGRRVRYRFHIENNNPDPQKYNGPIVWPALWTLGPTVFRITDTHENRKGESRSKQVALVEGVDEKGVPNRFKKVRVAARHQGILDFTLIDNDGNENFEEFQMVMFLELHPKNKNGLFPSSTEVTGVFERIDIKAAAVESRKARKLKDDAKEFVSAMTDEEARHYAAAMGMDETEDIEVLRDRLEGTAESDPQMLLAMKEDGAKVAAMSLVKRAIDQTVIGVNPVDGDVTWANTGNLIVKLGPNIGIKPDIDRLADWLIGSDKKAEAANKKLASLVV